MRTSFFITENERWYEDYPFHEEPYATGTTAYHCNPLNFLRSKLLYTDGIMATINALNCYWVLDLIAEKVIPLLRNLEKQGFKNRFVVIYVVRKNSTDQGVHFFVEDGNYNLLGRFVVKFSDIPENLQFFMSFNEDYRNILYLPSEH